MVFLHLNCLQLVIMDILLTGGDGIIDNNYSHTYSDLKSERIIKIIDPSSIATIESGYSNLNIEILNIGNTSKNNNSNLYRKRKNSL